MAAWVEASTRDLSPSAALISQSKTSLSASLLSGDAGKPALAPKPRLMPKPFAFQRNATIRPIKAPKITSARQLQRAASSDALDSLVSSKSELVETRVQNTSESVKPNGTLKVSVKSASTKPAPLGPKPALTPKTDLGQNPDTTQMAPNAKPEDDKNFQSRARAKSLGSQEHKALRQTPKGESRSGDADFRASSLCWPVRNRLSVGLTSRFESPEREVGSVRRDEPPLSPSESKPQEDEETSGTSIKRRISLLFDRSAASQHRDVFNKKDSAPAEISVDIKQRIKNLSLNTQEPKVRLPSTGDLKCLPHEKTPSDSAQSSLLQNGPAKTTASENNVSRKNSTLSSTDDEEEEEEDDAADEDKENCVSVPVYRRVGMAKDPERKTQEEEKEKQHKDEQLQKEREREKHLEEERKLREEMERRQEEERLKEERKQEEEKQRQREERRKQELERQKIIEEERKLEEERAREAERETRREQERLERDKQIEEQKRRMEEKREKERQREEQRLREEREKERLRKEKEMEEERQRIEEERQREKLRLRQEREKQEMIKKEREIEEKKRIEEEERLRREKENQERLKKEREMEEKRLLEEQRLRREREKEERLKKEREKEERKQLEEQRLRLEREKEERLKKEREMEERKQIEEEERLRLEREMERRRKEREMEERRRLEEQRLRQEREKERQRKEKEMEEKRQIEEEQRLRQEREMERLRKEREMEEKRLREERDEKLKQEREMEERMRIEDDKRWRQEKEKARLRMERDNVAVRRDLKRFDGYETQSEVSSQLPDVLYDDFSVKPRRWGTGTSRSSTPSPSGEAPSDDAVHDWMESNDPESPRLQKPQNSTGEDQDPCYQDQTETDSQTSRSTPDHVTSQQGELKNCADDDEDEEEDEDEYEDERDTEMRLPHESNNTDVDGFADNKINQLLQRLTSQEKQRKPSIESDAPEITDPEPLLFPKSSAPLLDSSVFRSKADLGKKRSIKRSRPSRAVRQRAALPALIEGSNLDWRFCDSSDGAKAQNSESGEEPSKYATPPPAPSRPKRVPVFPGMDQSALMTQLKRRSGLMETDVSEGQTTPAVSARSPRTPTLGPRVLPPVNSRDTGSGSSPSWLRELKSKKRLSRPESDA